MPHQPQKLDLNRGCLMRRHPNGSLVAMYYDAPGEYYDENNEALRAETAAEAGFEIERWQRERAKLLKMADFKARLDAEMEAAKQSLEEEHGDAPGPSSSAAKGRKAGKAASEEAEDDFI